MEDIMQVLVRIRYPGKEAIVVEDLTVVIGREKHYLAWMEVSLSDRDQFYRLECECDWKSNQPRSGCLYRGTVQAHRINWIRYHLRAQNLNSHFGATLGYLFGRLDNHQFIGQTQDCRLLLTTLERLIDIPPAELGRIIIMAIANGRLRDDGDGGILPGPRYRSF